MFHLIYTRSNTEYDSGNHFESKKDYEVDPDQFYSSEVFIVDDKEYFWTYSDEFNLHEGPYADSSYYHDYGQDIPFMLLKDFNEKKETMQW